MHNTTNVTELSINVPEGTADCSLEQQLVNGEIIWSVTILYPASQEMYGRSEVFCYNLRYDKASGNWIFREEEIHPKIKRLEELLSGSIAGIQSKK